MSNTTLHIVNINGKYQINDINGSITAHNISNDILTLRINGKSYSATIGESSPICISCTSSDPESKPDDGNTFSFSIKAEDIDGDIIDSRITMSLRTEFIVNGEIKRIFFKEWKDILIEITPAIIESKNTFRLIFCQAIIIKPDIAFLTS